MEEATAAKNEDIPRQKLYATFIDLSKGYDYVFQGGAVPQIVEGRLSGRKLALLISSTYDDVRSRVRLNGAVSEAFAQPRFDIRQGCVMSPYLFVVFLADLPIYTPSLPRKDALEYVPLAEPVVLLHCLQEQYLLNFPDDIVLLASGDSNKILTLCVNTS